MPTLKTNKKCFTTTLQQHQQIDLNLYIQDDDWLIKFIRICKPSATRQHFSRHIGDESHYSSKTHLINTLKFHYAILSGALKRLDPAFDISEDKKNAVILKINEETTSCTPGFHARVNSLLEGYFLPKTIEALFAAIRYNIVERAANKATNEVHANNQFFIVAKKMGLGVHPKLSDDPYTGAISHQQIEEKLKAAFSEQFQPFLILLHFKELIITPFDQYVGRKDSGYLINTYEPGLDYLKTFFEEESLNYDYLIVDSETSQVIDINWGLIFGKLWRIFIEKKYFASLSWTSSLHNSSIPFVGKFAKRYLKETDYNEAICLISRLFKDPSITDPQIEKIPNLFFSANECFAYLKCNQELSHDLKIRILISSSVNFYHKNKLNLNEFWQFAAEDRSLSEGFGEQFAKKFHFELKQFETMLLDDGRIFNEHIAGLTPITLKGYILQLSYIPKNSLIKLLLQNDNLFKLLLATKGHRDVMLLLIECLISRIPPQSLANILQKNHEQKNFVVRMILLSQKHAEPVIKLFQLIDPLSIIIKKSVFNLENKNETNVLMLALQHCPQVVPSILKLMLSYSSKQSHDIANYSLTHINMRNRHCFKPLLELSLMVHFLSKDAGNRTAYTAAIQLQVTLVTALDNYFKHHSDPTAFSRLQTQWASGLNHAKSTLQTVVDWDAFKRNVLLILISLPLLGIPLLINYYRTNYKSVFFQNSYHQQISNLEAGLDYPSLEAEIHRL